MKFQNFQISGGTARSWTISRQFSSKNRKIRFAFHFSFLRAIDENQEEFIELLRESVAIRSVSADPARRDDCIRMSEWARDVSSVSDHRVRP